MLLRSSSTPVLGSPLPTFADSPSNSIHSETSRAVIKHLPPIPQNNHKVYFHQTRSLNLSSFSCNSSPISPSITDLDRHEGFRRVESEGNLQELGYASCSNYEDHFWGRETAKRFSVRAKCLTLQTMPSCSFYDYNSMREEEEEKSDMKDEEEREELEEEKPSHVRRIGNRIMAEEGDDFSLENRVQGMILTEEVLFKDGNRGVSLAEKEEVGGKEMYLAGGLDIDSCGNGIGGCCIGGGGGAGGTGDYNYNSTGSGGDDGDRQGVEAYYKRMLDETPGNPLFLRNYAQFLYQCKQDRQGAEEYYSRAILADPKDGEVLSQYGKLIWELHQDQDRASSYFERAVQASPEDSHVHAAYASFLWDAEEDEDSCIEPQCLASHFHNTAVASARG